MVWIHYYDFVRRSVQVLIVSIVLCDRQLPKLANDCKQLLPEVSMFAAKIHFFVVSETNFVNVSTLGSGWSLIGGANDTDSAGDAGSADNC